MSGNKTAATWTEGVCDDGAVILCDGVPVEIEDVLARLNRPLWSLRDWFAGLAMSSVLGQRGGFDECVARASYEMADAMLKARMEDHHVPE